MLIADFGRQASYDCVNGLVLVAPGLVATRAIGVGRDSAPGTQGWVDEVRVLLEFALKRFRGRLSRRQAPPCRLDSGLHLMGADGSAVGSDPVLYFLGVDLFGIGTGGRLRGDGL